MSMTADERQAYATHLILEHARDIEWLSIFEMAEEYMDGGIGDADAASVSELIGKAEITVSWPS